MGGDEGEEALGSEEGDAAEETAVCGRGVATSGVNMSWRRAGGSDCNGLSVPHWWSRLASRWERRRGAMPVTKRCARCLKAARLWLWLWLWLWQHSPAGCAFAAFRSLQRSLPMECEVEPVDAPQATKRGCTEWPSTRPLSAASEESGREAVDVRSAHGESCSCVRGRRAIAGWSMAAPGVGWAGLAVARNTSVQCSFHVGWLRSPSSNQADTRIAMAERTHKRPITSTRPPLRCVVSIVPRHSVDYAPNSVTFVECDEEQRSCPLEQGLHCTNGRVPQPDSAAQRSTRERGRERAAQLRARRRLSFSYTTAAARSALG